VSYYPRNWREVLETAKDHFSAYLATQEAFPTQEEGFKEAKECIYTALATYRSEGYDVEPGMCYSLPPKSKY